MKTDATKLAPDQFIPLKYLPLPEPVQWPQHRVSYLPARPVIQSARDAARRLQASFECSCGANPLNDPHNLAVYAGQYHPLATATAHPPFMTLDATDVFSILNVNTNLRHRSTDLSTFDPAHDLRLVDSLFPARLLRFHTTLFRLLPAHVQDRLTDPERIDNLQSVKITDPDSNLIDLVQTYFPKNYIARTESRHQRFPHESYKTDQYNQEDWENWNLIHRQDQILMNPFPYIRARYDALRHENRPAVAPSKSLGSYHPALPSLHVVKPGFFSDFPAVRTKLGDPAPCWCGHMTPGRSHVQHVYYAFVGRTIMRALEIHGQPWQEVAIGKSYVEQDETSSYRDQATELYSIMRGEYNG